MRSKESDRRAAPPSSSSSSFTTADPHNISVRGDDVHLRHAFLRSSVPLRLGTEWTTVVLDRVSAESVGLPLSGPPTIMRRVLWGRGVRARPLSTFSESVFLRNGQPEVFSSAREFSHVAPLSVDSSQGFLVQRSCSVGYWRATPLKAPLLCIFLSVLLVLCAGLCQSLFDFPREEASKERSPQFREGATLSLFTWFWLPCCFVINLFFPSTISQKHGVLTVTLSQP